MYMLMFLLFKNKQTKNCVHNAFTIPVMTKERLLLFLFLFLFFSVTKRNIKSRKQVSNVWVVRLTRVSRVIETVCSVFASVSVIHCNVCAYVALHFHFEICS